MDFALTEEQEMLRHSVAAPVRRSLRLRRAQALRAGAGRLQPRAVGALCRARPARAAVCGRARRLGRRAGRDHDRDGRGRPCARARALSLDRRARRRAVRLGGGKAQCADLVPKIAGGDHVAFAHAERQSRYDLADVAASARREGAGYVLDGAKRPGAARRQRRKVHRVGAAFRRPARPRRLGAVRGRCRGERRVDARLCHDRRAARRRGDARRRARRCRRRHRRARQGLPADRACRRHGDRGACRRGGRRDGGDARADRRLHEDAQAVRRRPSAASRPCSTAPPRCWSRSSRRAAWRCWRQ